MADYQNSRLVEWGLLLFSTFIVIVLICNVVEYSHLISIKNNPNFSDDTAQTWLVVNIVLLVIAVIYWLYRMYHFIFSPGVRQQYAAKAKEYFLETEYTGVIGIKNAESAATIQIEKPFSDVVSRKTSGDFVKVGAYNP
jgi:hypothetical protein